MGIDVKGMVDRARQAQVLFERDFDQRQVDLVVQQLAKVVFDNAQSLARCAVEETMMGDCAFKTEKNKEKARTIWNSIRDKKSIGIISRDEKSGIVEIAKPMGVVAAVIPVTNPTVTPMCNAMFALKGRNSIVIAPHPRAKACMARLADAWQKALLPLGIPDHLIQFIAEPTLELTQELMSLADVVVATGGPGMVRAAYSSGKPSFGVGQGNVQCILDRGVDLRNALSKVIEGRIFDNGLVCSGEQTLIVPEESFNVVLAELEEQNSYVVRDDGERAKLLSVLFTAQGAVNKDLVGKSVAAISRASGVYIPASAVMIVLPEDNSAAHSPLRKEKMFPILTCFTYHDFEEAIHIAQANLDIEGKGHSVSIHSNDTEHIERAGLALDVSRIVVNASCAITDGGSFFNGFSPSTTLGCGSWGNNSISENLSYKHLLNITRIGYPLIDPEIPTDAELWSEG